MPIEDEIRELAEQLAVTENEDVRDIADVVCEEYKRQVQMLHALDQVDRMVTGDTEKLDRQRDERLQKAREQLRHRLRSLLTWARGSGRMPF